jgi:hypothetical protein
MQDRLEGQKPSHQEWLYWAQIVGDRLMACVHIYSRPPYRDNLLSHLDRHTRNAILIDLLHRLHALTDETVTPTDSLADVAYHDERVIDGLTVLLDDVLRHLPRLSADMQILLKASWRTRTESSVGNDIFFGPNNAAQKGIGSGRPEHGRLPGALYELLQRERTDERRMPRHALIRTDLARPQDKAQRRWADQNSQFLRRAGTVQ